MSTRFHERLVAARKLRRVTQQAIADSLDVGQSAVSHWCTGRSEPDRDTVTALAGLLEVRAAWLLLGDGPMTDGDRPPVRPTRGTKKATGPVPAARSKPGVAAPKRAVKGRDRAMDEALPRTGT
jgi:transcriptional regulator with XRE-family HTH domain